MTEPLSVSFPYSADQHATALGETGIGRIHRRVIHWSAVVALLMAVIAIVAGIAFAKIPDIEVIRQVGPLLLFPAVWFAVPNLLHRFSRWSLARKHGTGDEFELRVFSEDGFVGSSRWSQPVPWFLIERVAETPNYFLVYATHEGPSYVPKAALQPADVERLREMLANYSTRTGMSLKPRPGWILS